MALPYKFSGRSCIKWVMVVLLLEAISHMERLVVRQMLGEGMEEDAHASRV